jgi:hypothetical protein
MKREKLTYVKLIVIISLIVVTTPLMAGLWDFGLGDWLLPIENALRYGEIDRSSSSGIAKSHKKSECLQKFDEIQAKHSGKEPIGAIYLIGSGISKSEIENPMSLPDHDISSDSNARFFPGIAYFQGRRWNSYNPNQAPHLMSGCSKFWQVKHIVLAKWKGNLCRRVTMAMMDKQYQVIYCKDDHRIYSDFSNTPMQFVETFKCTAKK